MSQSVAIKGSSGTGIIADRMGKKSSMHSMVSSSTKPASQVVPNNWKQVAGPVSEEASVQQSHLSPTTMM